jgi:hypothetical protein
MRTRQIVVLAVFLAGFSPRAVAQSVAEPDAVQKLGGAPTGPSLAELQSAVRHVEISRSLSSSSKKKKGRPYGDDEIELQAGDRVVAMLSAPNFTIQASLLDKGKEVSATGYVDKGELAHLDVVAKRSGPHTLRVAEVYTSDRGLYSGGVWVLGASLSGAVPRESICDRLRYASVMVSAHPALLQSPGDSVGYESSLWLKFGGPTSDFEEFPASFDVIPGRPSHVLGKRYSKVGSIHRTILAEDLELDSAPAEFERWRTEISQCLGSDLQLDTE